MSLDNKSTLAVMLTEGIIDGKGLRETTVLSGDVTIELGVGESCGVVELIVAANVTDEFVEVVASMLDVTDGIFVDELCAGQITVVFMGWLKLKSFTLRNTSEPIVV
jgi:hypothetical protein